MARQRKVIRTKNLYKKHRFPKKVAGRVLFVVLILALIGAGFIVMREWSLRFGQNAQKNPSPSSTVSPPPSSESVSSEPVSSEEEKPIEVSQLSAYISAEDLLKDKATLGEKLKSLKAEGYTAVTIELKPITGMLPYTSTVADAVKYGVISENALSLAEIVSAVNSAGLTPIAQLSTFKDQAIPHVSRNNSFAYENQLATNWLDDSVARGGKAWLNPYMETARKYLSEITAEVSLAGFKTIILENIMFPDRNTTNMNTILTTPSREEILKQAVTEMTASAGGAVVIPVINMATSASKEGSTNPLSTELQASKNGDTEAGIYISLAEVEAKKEAICQKAGIIGIDGYDSKIAVAEVVKGVLSQIGEQKPTIVLSKADYDLLKAILTELKLEDVIVR